MKRHIQTFFLLAALIYTPVAVRADATRPFRCASVPEMAGESMKSLLVKHIEQNLKSRNWQDVSVEIESFQQSQSNFRNRQLIETGELTRGVTVALDQKDERAATVRGRLGDDKRVRLNCSISVKKSAIFVSGQYKADDGQIVRVKRAPVDVSGLQVPGILVPAQMNP